MVERIRVGVVGANPTRGWALGTHLPALKALPQFELVAVATRHEDSARATADLFEVPHAFGDPADLVAHPDVDLVTVSVKVPHHYELTRAALEAGKHVFCEWPLGANTAEAIDLLELATERGRRHVIGLQGQRSPIVNYVRDLVAEEYVGELLHVILSIEGGGRGGEITADREWTTDKANGVGTLRIIGGHNLDVLRYVVGEFSEMQATVAARHAVVKVVDTGAQVANTVPDVILIQGRVQSGAYVSVAVQAGLPKGFGARFELQGTEGVLVVSGRGTLHVGDASLQLSGARGDGQIGPLDVPEQYRTVPEAVPDTAARNVAGLYLTLADAVASGEQPSVLEPSFATAVSLHHLIDHIEEASTSGQRRSLS